MKAGMELRRSFAKTASGRVAAWLVAGIVLWACGGEPEPTSEAPTASVAATSVSSTTSAAPEPAAPEPAAPDPPAEPSTTSATPSTSTSTTSTQPTAPAGDDDNGDATTGVVGADDGDAVGDIDPWFVLTSVFLLDLNLGTDTLLEGTAPGSPAERYGRDHLEWRLAERAAGVPGPKPAIEPIDDLIMVCHADGSGCDFFGDYVWEDGLLFGFSTGTDPDDLTPIAGTGS